MSIRIVSTRSVVLSILFIFTSAIAALGGPPWMSIEVPANPLDRTTRGAAMLVHTYHHANPMEASLQGQAEGLVAGQRRSIPLKLTATSRQGVYALEQQWPSDGAWVIVLSMSGHAETTTLIEMGPNGGFKRDNYFNQQTSIVALRSVRVLPRQVSATEIESALQSLVAGTLETHGKGLPSAGPLRGLWLPAGIGVGVALFLFGSVTLFRTRRTRAE